MKILFTILAAVLLTASVFLPRQAGAQSPEKMSYQAVIRNSSDVLVTDTQVGMQISILQGTIYGAAVYVETQTPTTNANGLVSIEIGDGTVLNGDFTAIDWANGPYFIKTETNPAGSTSYTITGTSQLLSVPYALHAKTAETVVESDPLFTSWDKTTGISITESQISDLGTYIETEIQNLDHVLTQNNSAGNKNIRNLADPVNDQDAVTKAYLDAFLDQLYAEGALRVRDADGNYYNTVKIGDQIWMAENLKTTKYNDNTPIPLVTDGTAWGNLTTPGYCWYNNNQANYGDTYGPLYNWYTVETGNLCPAGWHVPTDAEWTQLTDYLGGESVAGGKLKETGTTHWNSPNEGATNESFFTALPVGYRSNNGNFYGVGGYGYWWSASESNTNYAWYRSVNSDYSKLRRTSYAKEIGFSVRCLRD